MGNRVTLHITDDILRRARSIADRSGKDVEEVLAEWLDRFVDDLPVEMLPDEDVLALCNFEMNFLQKQELRGLLFAHRARELDDIENERMDDLLRLYRRGVIRRAQALEIAEARGLLG